MDRTYCIFGDSVTQASYVKDVGQTIKPLLETKHSDSSVNVFTRIEGTPQLILLMVQWSICDYHDIIFAIGVNDSAYLIGDGSAITDEEQFKANLLSLIERAHKFTQNITFVGAVLGDDSILKPFPQFKRKIIFSSTDSKYDNMLKELGNNNCKFIYVLDKLNKEDFKMVTSKWTRTSKMFRVIKEYF